MLLLLAVGAGATAYCLYQRAKAVREANERAASAALKTLASAEADFRANDRDGNRIQDFWTGDVASLADWKEIEASVAAADAKPLHPGATPLPKAGYLFIAMDLDENGVAYAQDTQGLSSRGSRHNFSKFGFCAYPADYPRSGKWTFTINEGNTIFKSDTRGKPVMSWPADPSCRCSTPHPGRRCPYDCSQ